MIWRISFQYGKYLIISVSGGPNRNVWLWIRRSPQETGATRAPRPAAWNPWIQMPWGDQELIITLFYPDLPWAARCPPCHFGPIVSQVPRPVTQQQQPPQMLQMPWAAFQKKRKLDVLGQLLPLTYLNIYPTHLFFCSVGLVRFPWGWGSVLMAKQHHQTNLVPGQMACYCPWNKALMGPKIGGALLSGFIENGNIGLSRRGLEHRTNSGQEEWENPLWMRYSLPLCVK